MLKKERWVYIIKRLQEIPTISVKTLSEEMNVSLSTAQRDLNALSKEGKIERSFGGAISNDYAEILSTHNEISVSAKVHIHESEKNKIALFATEQVKSHDCIFLDSGTTVAQMVPFLKNKDITIVTNSQTVLKAVDDCKATVIFIGGTFDPKYDMMRGANVFTQMKAIRFDKAFLSASGIDLERGEITTVDSEISMMKQVVIKRSEKKYLLVDDSKFDLSGIYTYAKCSDIDGIITNDYPKGIKKLKNVIIVK